MSMAAQGLIRAYSALVPGLVCRIAMAGIGQVYPWMAMKPVREGEIPETGLALPVGTGPAS
jgi:hypothetical protein